MKSKVLLINFDYRDQEKIRSLGVDVDLGYVSNAHPIINQDGKNDQSCYFFSPLAIYEYKMVFVKLMKKPPLEISFRDKATCISEKDRENFIKYWWRGRGVLAIFLERNEFQSLINFGMPYVILTPASGRDVTVKFVLDDENRPFRQLFKEAKDSVVVPTLNYLIITRREGSYERGDWEIYNLYENLNDEALGVYLNVAPSYSNEDRPLFIVLPAFRDYAEIITRVLKSIAKIYKNFIPEIYEADWVDGDKYYPREAVYFDQQIKELLEQTDKKLEELINTKREAKNKWVFLRAVLYASSDDLKKAVIKILTDIWNLKVKDVDIQRKTNLREDILIEDGDMAIFGEVKGTRNQNPSLKYITQLLTNVLKSGKQDAIGALILNHDLEKDPEERTEAYTAPDEEDSLKEIIYIDTRVLFSLSIAILDYGLSVEDAKGILFKKGRVKFDLNRYIKTKIETK
jgi:hypothetical protein